MLLETILYWISWAGADGVKAVNENGLALKLIVAADG